MKAFATRAPRSPSRPGRVPHAPGAALAYSEGRPEWVAQRAADRSPEVQEQRALQDRINRSAVATALACIARRTGACGYARVASLPDRLRARTEALAGVPMDGVRVHYDSERPAQLGALAYAQGADIHLGPGQQTHLPHEAWHVAQQRQGRVRRTLRAHGLDISEDRGLEAEAERMGARAQAGRPPGGAGALSARVPSGGIATTPSVPVVQRLVAAVPAGPTDDLTFMNTTLTAHANVGGKIKHIDRVNFAQDFEDLNSENLAITGHGDSGKISGLSAQQVANKLTDLNTGLKTAHRIPDEIHFENCYAATPSSPVAMDDVLSTVKRALDKHLAGGKVPKLIGPHGNQITTKRPPQGGGAAVIEKVVVERDKASPQHTAAEKVQACLYNAFFHAGQKVATGLDANDDGQTFLQNAAHQEAKVSDLKWIFINVVRGTPLPVADYDQIELGLQARLIQLWNQRRYDQATGYAGAQVFQNGVNLADKDPLKTL